MRVGDGVLLAADPTTEGRVVRILDAWHVRVYWLTHPTHARRWTVERVEPLERSAPTWLDEAGRPCPTVPCPRCGRPVPRMRIPARTLRGLPDWRPFQVTRTPSWCGHAVPMVALPRARRLVGGRARVGAERAGAKSSGAMGAARLEYTTTRRWQWALIASL